MKNIRLISLLFYTSAVYDGLLGIIFLFFPLSLYKVYSVTFPNHNGYVQFPALLLIIFGIMFLNIARKPVQNRNLMPYGILLKAAYCGVVFVYWFSINIPDMWKPFAIIDLIFGILFYLSYRSLQNNN